MRAMLQAFNSGNAAAVDNLLDANIRSNAVDGLSIDPADDNAPNIDRVKHEIRQRQQSFSDARYEELDCVAEGDRVTLRWRFVGVNDGPLFGRPATNREVTLTGTETCRVLRGKIVEHIDDHENIRVSVLNQLGLISDPEIRARLGFA